MYTLILIHTYAYHRISLDIISIIIVTIDRTLPMLCEGLLSAEMSVPHRRWLCHSTVIDRFRWDCSRQFRWNESSGAEFFSQNETAGLSAENPSERRNGGGYIKNLLRKTKKLASGLTQKPDWIPPFFGEGHQPVHMCLFFPPSAKWGRFWQRSTRRHRSLVFRRPPLEKGAVHGTSHCRHRAFGRRTPGTKRPSEDLKALADLP